MRSVLLAFSALCFGLAILFGLLSGWTVGHPDTLPSWLAFTSIRPLHTLLAMAWIIQGTMVVSQLTVNKHPGVGQSGLFIGGTIITALLVMFGVSSGREYISWPAIASLPMFLGLLLAAIAIFQELPKLLQQNPAAAWMLGIGAVLLPLGFIEVHLFLIPAIGLDPARDLTLQWHGLDTMIGAWNAMLFACGAVLAGPGKVLTPIWHRALFVVTATGLLLTYSHHHYPSPQPYWLKEIAFYTSLLAAIGFIHHIRIWQRCSATATPIERMLHVAGNWTVFAIATGFLMALPPLNTLTHGTYVVVGHAMGSMIGVNSMLLLALSFHFYPLPERFNPWLHRCIRGANWLLLAMIGELIVAGIVKGVLRFQGDYFSLRESVTNTLVFLPYIGLGLAFMLLPLVIGLIWRTLIEDGALDGPTAENAQLD